MFRNLALASVATLGMLVPSAAQAQVAFSFGMQAPAYNYAYPYRSPGSYYPGYGYSGYGYGHGHMHVYRVQYRAPFWQDSVFFDLRDARRFESLKLAEGCDVDLARVGLNWVVRYRTAGWRTYTTVYSHREAHELEHWLERQGYQARVVHY